MSIYDAKKHGDVSAITADDLNAVVKLYEEYLNYGEGVRPHLDKVLRDPDTIALKHTIDGEITGFYIYTKGIALSGGHNDLLEKLAKLSEGKRVYTGDAIVLKREYRRLSIMKTGFDAMLKELRRKGAELLVHELWVHPNGYVPASVMSHVFNKNIFIGRYENFYRDFRHFGFICPICGKDCLCAADIYLCEVPDAAPWN